MARLGEALSEVPLGPLREAFFRSGLSAAEVARRAGCDESYVRRLLKGQPLQVHHRRKDGRAWYVHLRSTSYENAVRFARAIGVDPIDVGL